MPVLCVLVPCNATKRLTGYLLAGLEVNDVECLVYMLWRDVAWC